MKKSIVRGLVKQGKFDHLSAKARLVIWKTGKCPRGYDVHHVVPESTGGLTELDNLMPLKIPHHRLSHKVDFINMYIADMQELPLIRDKEYFATIVLKSLDNSDKEYKSNVHQFLSKHSYKAVGFYKPKNKQDDRGR